MPRISKLLRLIVNLVFLISIYYFLTRTYFTPTLRKKLTRYLPDIKYLLLWTNIHGLKENGQKQFLEKKCFNFNCYVTRNRNMLGDIRYFDGIIFNLQDVSQGMQELPEVRIYSQKYIFAANDSSDNFPVCDPVYEDFFNWTWTYKTDSTIPYRFFSVYNIKHEQLESHFDRENIIVGTKLSMRKHVTFKSKAAAIFLDHCTTRSKRELFVEKLLQQLQRYNMTIDIFGKCGNKECRKKTMKPCFWKLKKFYFFYLALEDSFAEDYVTKDVLYAYENNAVPIVYGTADYNRFLPPDSYIDGRRLGVKELADVMYQTITDPLRYDHFFKWKSHYSIRGSDVLDICELCKVFNSPTWMTYATYYKEFRKWWNPMFEKRCVADQ